MRVLEHTLTAEFGGALSEVSAVLKRGRRAHPDHWLEHPASFHLEHARRHLELLDQGDSSEPHLQHATTRLLMALEAAQRAR